MENKEIGTQVGKSPYKTVTRGSLEYKFGSIKTSGHGRWEVGKMGEGNQKAQR